MIEIGKQYRVKPGTSMNRGGYGYTHPGRVGSIVTITGNHPLPNAYQASDGCYYHEAWLEPINKEEDMGSIEEFIAKRKLTPNQKKLLEAGLMDVKGELTTTAKKVIEDAVVEGKNAADELQAVATEFLAEKKKCTKKK